MWLETIKQWRRTYPLETHYSVQKCLLKHMYPLSVIFIVIKKMYMCVCARAHARKVLKCSQHKRFFKKCWRLMIGSGFWEAGKSEHFNNILVYCCLYMYVTGFVCHFSSISTSSTLMSQSEFYFRDLVIFFLFNKQCTKASLLKSEANWCFWLITAQLSVAFGLQKRWLIGGREMITGNAGGLKWSSLDEHLDK